MSNSLFSLKPVDQVTVTTLMDNYVDLLLQDTEKAARPPRSRGSEVPTNTLVAEHGLAQLVKTYEGDTTHAILFDTGYTRSGVLHNVDLLGVELDEIEAVVLSHAHMDHTGSLYPILEPTVEALKEMHPNMIVPMHCTGWKAIQRFAEAFPDAFALNSVGTTYALSQCEGESKGRRNGCSLKTIHER